MNTKIELTPQALLDIAWHITRPVARYLETLTSDQLSNGMQEALELFPQLDMEELEKGIGDPHLSLSIDQPFFEVFIDALRNMRKNDGYKLVLLYLTTILQVKLRDQGEQQ